MIKLLLNNVPKFIILITISGVISKILPGKLPQAYNYLVYCFFGVTCLLYYCSNFRRIHNENKLISWVYIYIIIYIIAGVIKQCFVPSGLFPFFRLSISMALLSIGAIFIFQYENHLIAKTFHLWWKYVPIIFISFFWVLEPSQYIQVLSFCLFYLFLFPLFKIKRKLIIILAILFITIGGMEQRIDYINVAIALILLLNVVFIKKISITLLKKTFQVLMFIPILFLLLFGVWGFNILKLDQFINDEVQLAGQLNNDTRSFLYEEAWISSNKNDYLIQGRTPFYGYDSRFAANREGDALITNKQEAQRISEVFIVNVLTWFGIFGIIIFFLFYYKTGKRALRKSQNPYLPIFSLYIGFFWIESWIGNILFAPNAVYILLCIIISICNNVRIQRMNFIETKIYLQKLLNS